MSRLARALGTLCQLLGAALLVFVVLEVGATAFLAARDGDRVGGAALDPRADTELYRDQPWTTEYFREFHQVRAVAWEPYAYWRRQPFEGRWIGVDVRGHRRTWAPPPAAPGEPRRPVVWFLGGSTTWGSGQRDDHTLPSLVARHLAEAGHPVEALNLGESGWVGTQECIYLMRLLQRGERPDWVVFFDGFNDVFASYQHGRAGAGHNEFHRDFEFGLATGVGPRRGLEALARSLSLVRLAKALLGRLRGAGRPPWPGPGDPTERERRLRELVQVFEENRRMTRALAAEYGFRVLTYLQPSLFEKPRRTAHEAREAAADPHAEAFYRDAYTRLRAAAAPGDARDHFADISEIFAAEPGPVFADVVHTGEAAVEPVARRVAEDLLARLGERP